jgi:hypothetical protein
MIAPPILDNPAAKPLKLKVPLTAHDIAPSAAAAPVAIAPVSMAVATPPNPLAFIAPFPENANPWAALTLLAADTDTSRGHSHVSVQKATGYGAESTLRDYVVRLMGIFDVAVAIGNCYIYITIDRACERF